MGWGLAGCFSGSGSGADSGREPSRKSRVCVPTDMVLNWRAAVMPWMTSRMRERAVRGERKISASSALAATAART
jgi:hypothetical protein